MSKFRIPLTNLCKKFSGQEIARKVGSFRESLEFAYWTFSSMGKHDWMIFIGAFIVESLFITVIVWWILDIF